MIAKLWPNGEIAFHLPKKLKEQSIAIDVKPLRPSIWRWWHLAYGLASAVEAALRLGLSSARNFDKPKKPLPRYGLKGITSLGRRRVRNAAYMLSRENGKHRLTFATVTLPALSCEDMITIHLNWHKVIDRYRLLLTRSLRAGGLTGEVVGVSEIQGKRHEESKFPVLHGHFVFVGANRRGGWVITPRRHDYIWRKSLQSVLYGPLPPIKSACQLKSVEKSVEGYLGKYMSKGVAAISSVSADGFEWALPKQWWSCSRSLVARMERQLRYFSEGVQWLISRASAGDTEIWAFYSVVSIKTPDGVDVDVGSYGRLTPFANGAVRKFLGLS